MSLRDEILADQSRSGQGCSVCRWLATLSPKDKAEWVTILADGTLQHASIFRAINRRNEGAVTRSSVENHRGANHKP